jgi:chitinase
MEELVTQTHCARLVIGGAGRSSGFRSAPTERLVQSIATAVRTYGYDGVEIDWEPLNNWDNENATGIGAGRWQPFVRALRAALPRDASLSIAITYPYRSAKDSQLEQMVADVEPLVDEVILMAYGMSGPWPGWVSWPGSALSQKRSGRPILLPGTTKPLPSVEEMVARYAAAGVPVHKMTLGLAAFGHPWHGTWQPLQPAGSAWRGGEFQYQRILRDFRAYLATQRCWSSTLGATFGVCWDRYAKVPYLWHNDPTKTPAMLYLPFENAASWRQKARWAENRGLGGLTVWEVTGDLLPSGDHPLLRALQ